MIEPALLLLLLLHALLQGLALGKVKGLGGKLGTALQELCGAEVIDQLLLRVNRIDWQDFSVT